MRLTFRLVEGVQQIFLPKVGGGIIPFLKGLSRVKNKRRGCLRSVCFTVEPRNGSAWAFNELELPPLALL